MPKFLATKIVVKTFHTWADTAEEAREAIIRWQEGESEEPEGGIKVTSYKLGWEEFKMTNEQIVAGRNQVLANFLELMTNVIPGAEHLKKRESKLIVLPYDPFPDVPIETDDKRPKPNEYI